MLYFDGASEDREEPIEGDKFSDESGIDSESYLSDDELPYILNCVWNFLLEWALANIWRVNGICIFCVADSDLSFLIFHTFVCKIWLGWTGFARNNITCECMEN